MEKLSSTTIYQLSLSGLKEAISAYMKSKHQLDLNIISIEDVQTDIGVFGYDRFGKFDGVKVYVKG